MRGPTIVSGYYKNEDASAKQIDREGWFATGDVAKIDPGGWLTIVDRTKDLVKSGGEWISSIDVENAALACKGIANCAVIGVRHPNGTSGRCWWWSRRRAPTRARREILETLGRRIAKWQMPDDVVFIDALPLTATGKISKKDLRAQFADYSCRSRLVQRPPRDPSPLGEKVAEGRMRGCSQHLYK